MQLTNSEEVITGYGWNGTYTGPSHFEPEEPVRICGKRRFFNGSQVVDIMEAVSVIPSPADALRLLPTILFRHPGHAAALETVIDSITHKTLREFALRTFLDRNFAKSFIQAPASLKYHHAYPGGLLAHSIECAQIIIAIPTLSNLQRDLAICAALFHDAGKTLVFTENMTRNNLGHLVDHDSLTLEVLYRPLHWLDQAWPDAGMALRHIWTCKNIRRWGYSPRMAVAHLVQLADRVSSEMNKEQRAFENLEDWRQISQSMDKHRYWRLLPNDAELIESSVQAHHG